MKTFTWGLLLLVGFILLDSCSCVSVPTFSNKTCASKHCVGYTAETVQWYVFRALSYSEDKSEIDDDNYIDFIPIRAKLCRNGEDGCAEPLEVFDLQQATSFSTEGEIDVWNGASGICVYYTLLAKDSRGTPFELLIKVYLMQYATRVVEPSYTFKVNPGDVVIDFHWNYTSGYPDTNLIFEMEMKQFSASCWIEIDNDNAWTQYQFTKGNCDTKELLGYPLSVSPEAVLDGDSALPVTTQTVSNYTTGLVQISIPYNDNTGGNYNVIVSTGKDKFFIWMVTLIVVGVLLFVSLSAGFGYYFFQQKKANAKQFQYDNVMGYSD